MAPCTSAVAREQGAHLYETSEARTPEADDALNIHTD